MEEVRFDLFLKKEQDLAKGNLTCEGKEGELVRRPSIRKKVPLGETREMRLDEILKSSDA